MAIRSARERLWQALAFELGGLAMVAPVYGLIMGAGAAESVALVAAVAVAAAVWSPLHNHLFDAAEWRMAGRVASDRPARLRMVHAVSHEASTTIITLPVIMVVGGHGFWAALAIDLAMTAFYAAYTYVFHVLWDRWRPVRLSAPVMAILPDVDPQDARQWRRDPLSHPDLQTMDKRALGDLPFDPERILPE
jgi:uncharacterized membrane protein